MKKILIAMTSIIVGIGIGACSAVKILSGPLNRNVADAKKYQTYFSLMNKWLKINQKEKKIEEYFTKKGYQSVAIYGMGDMGECLINELKKSAIDIKYGIDQNAEAYNSDKFLVLKPDDELPVVDAIIVTPIFYFEDIEYVLHNKVKYSIISLEEVLAF